MEQIGVPVGADCAEHTNETELLNPLTADVVKVELAD
jgi:hypothetical protein